MLVADDYDPKEPAVADTQAPPAPTETPDTQSVYAPTVPLVTAAWHPLPARTQDQDGEPKPRRPKRGGVPVGPALLSGANATSIATTAAYATGGWPAMAAAGGGVAAVTVAAAWRRRSTVKRRTQQRAAKQRTGSGSTGLGRGYSGGSPRVFGGGRGRASSGGSSRGPGGRSGSATAGLFGGAARKAGAPSSPRSNSPRGTTGGAAAGGASRLQRAADRRSSGQQRRGKDTTGEKTPRAARKAAKLAAKQRLREQRAKMPPSRARQLAAAAARKTRDAWTRPHRAQARAALRKHLRRAAGATHDGAAALLRAAGTALFRRSLKAGLERLREVWRRRRTKRATKNQTAEATPGVATTVRRPTNPFTAPTSRGAAMSGHHFVAAAEEMARAAAAYEPQGMLQVGADFARLQEALALVAEAMKITVQQAHQKFPLNPQIIDHMENIWGVQKKAAEMATELPNAFRNLHQVDLARLETPRNGEEMWDVTRNR